MLEGLREALEQFLDSAATGRSDDRGKLMQQAVIDARVALDEMRSQRDRTVRKLEVENRALADTERRGKLALEIEDMETVQVAEDFAEKHRERVRILEQKLEVQNEELELAERELQGMKTQLQEAREKGVVGEASEQVEAAWRTIERAGGMRPETDLEGEILKNQMNRADREARAEEQLRELKKKMGR